MLRFLFIVLLVQGMFLDSLFAQIPATLKADSWAQVRQRGSGTVTALWNSLDPFIFRDHTGQLIGVEHDVMQSFVVFLQRRYGVRVHIEWIEVASFDKLLPYIAQTKQPGVFGWAYYSITEQRLQQVRFTPPYMPDINVLVTNGQVPGFRTDQELLLRLKDGEGYTMANTTMSEDLHKLQQLIRRLPVRFLKDDYVVMQQISRQENAFGYLPLSVYVVGLQNGLNIKRQKAMTIQRLGYAGIYPRHSDWQPIVDTYFSSAEFGRLSQRLLQRYLGSQMSALVLSESDSVARINDDRELLRLEKEIVTQRFVDAALRIEQEKLYRNLTIMGVLLFVVIAGILYGRTVIIQRLNTQLTGQNDIIRQQNREIELMNRKLELKVLQAQMNPHFIFNSLNAIQYFVSLDEKRRALGYISAFSRFMRLLLTNASAPATPVSQEVRLLEQYLSLEKERFSNKFDYEIDVANDESLLLSPIPSLIIHPFVENALYHGVLNRSDSHGFIHIRFEHEAALIRVIIDDNGIGREAATTLAQRKKGTDLTPHNQLVKDRLTLINQQSDRKVTLETIDLTDHESNNKGTRVILQFPKEIL